MISLRKARDEGTIKQFAKKRDADTPKGDANTFNRVLSSMAGTSKEAPVASRPGRSDD